MDLTTSVFCVILALVSVCEAKLPDFDEQKTKVEKNRTIWALLVAGSSGWGNYRHQADICHAYQIMHRHGVTDEHIVVMMKDDIAENSLNPEPGTVINRPYGMDVYKGVLKDYTGEDVNPENFLNILSGNHRAMKGIGSGKVIESGPEDNVFVYFADHGATGLIGFPEGELYAKDLNHTLYRMYKKKKFRQLVFYMEACESGSMFKDLLPNDINIYAMTAANDHESSWGCYCENPERLPCLGDLFSIVWMQDSDKEKLSKETLEHQFEVTKKLTNRSHVQHFGDLSILTENVADFQGHMDAEGQVQQPLPEDMSPVESRDIPLHYLQRQAQLANSIGESQEYELKLSRMKAKRALLESYVQEIVYKLVIYPVKRMRILHEKPTKLTRFDCHKATFATFGRKCFSFAKNPYALKYSFVFFNLCEQGLDEVYINAATAQVCSSTEAILYGVE